MPHHPEFAPVAILAALSLFLPIPSHWRAGNVATLSIIAWLLVCNLVYAVDALVWADNVKIVIPVWCDITTKLLVGANVALPAACLCICIHLEQVSSTRVAQTTFSDKRRRQWFELAMCVGLPCLIMALHYIVQGHRFDIIESYGCRANIYFSLAGIFIIFVPPMFLSTLSIIFAGLALRHFMLRRLSFAAHLHSSNSALTPSRYIRLITMAALQMVWSITATAYSLSYNLKNRKLRPWTGWEDVHWGWSRIDVFPMILIPASVERAYCILWWVIPVSTFLFVGFFAFGSEAMGDYKKCLEWVWTRVFRQSLKRDMKMFGFKKDAKSFVLPLTSLNKKSKSSLRGTPISKPKPVSSFDSGYTDFDTTTDNASTLTCSIYDSKDLPPLPPPTSTAVSSKRNTQVTTNTTATPNGGDFNLELTQPETPTSAIYLIAKAIGSYSDFSIYTPSMIDDGFGAPGSPMTPSTSASDSTVYELDNATRNDLSIPTTTTTTTSTGQIQSQSNQCTTTTTSTSATTSTSVATTTSRPITPLAALPIPAPLTPPPRSRPRRRPLEDLFAVAPPPPAAPVHVVEVLPLSPRSPGSPGSRRTSYPVFSPTKRYPPPFKFREPGSGA